MDGLCGVSGPGIAGGLISGMEYLLSDSIEAPALGRAAAPPRSDHRADGAAAAPLSGGRLRVDVSGLPDKERQRDPTRALTASTTLSAAARQGPRTIK